MKKIIKKRDLISMQYFSQKEIWNLLLLSQKLRKQGISKSLQGKSVGLIFQKPSTRTAVSFAVGVVQLGGHPLILNADVLQIKRGESPRDTGRVLSRYLDCIVVRANRHEDVQEMARYADIPVINGLTNKEHPCQVLADILTIMDHKKMKHHKELKGFHVAYLGDGNNMAHSWMIAAALLDMRFTLACPKGYEPEKEIHDLVNKINSKSVRLVDNPFDAVTQVDALYTDVWTSMGQESEREKRLLDFSSYQINSSILSKAKKGALVMHCLPAHRGEEITEDVLEGPNSVVFDQAENRLHVQKAILYSLINRKI